MPFQLSPGVAVIEKDFTSIVPAVGTSTGATVGTFVWGPVNQPVFITSENELVRRFGRPDNPTASSFYTAANFLAYANSLYVSRVEANAQRNAVATPSGSVNAVQLSNTGSNYSTNPTITFSAPDVEGGVQATGTAVLSGGGVTSVAISNGGSAYVSATVTFSAPQKAGGVTATGTVTIVGGVITGIVITNAGSGYLTAPTATINSATGNGVQVGAVTITGSSIIAITITNPGTGYLEAPTLTITDSTGSNAAGTPLIAVGGVKINNQADYDMFWRDGSGVIGPWAAKCPGDLGNAIRVSMCDNAADFATWDYKDEFDSAPGTSEYAASVSGANDEIHIVVVDADGRWTKTPGAVLEKYAYVSKAADSKKSDGSMNFYKLVINSRSEYLWWTDYPINAAGDATVANWGDGAANTDFDLCGISTYTLSGGLDGNNYTDGQMIAAWEFYKDEHYDISLCPTGHVSTTIANYVIQNVCEYRKDCMAFISPVDVDAANEPIIELKTASETLDKFLAYRNEITSSSYAVIDSGFKYQYDRYNDRYRWIPLNGDIAGLCARTDYTNDPWFSPGGLNRGQIKNVVKLGVYLHKAQRDVLYKNGINPVISFPGEGTVLFGDKTALTKPSAFDRINVRRLFITLEKSIAIAAKYQLFEFNDPFTRAQFRNLVEPFLRDVQGRRGIIDFVVKCDDSNNTGEVIDRNEFVADIFIKPARSINFISLNFIAARSGINFTEIGG